MALGVLASGFVNDADAAPTMAATARDGRRERATGGRLTRYPRRGGRALSVTLTRWLLLTALPSPCP